MDILTIIIAVFIFLVVIYVCVIRDINYGRFKGGSEVDRKRTIEIFDHYGSNRITIAGFHYDFDSIEDFENEVEKKILDMGIKYFDSIAEYHGTFIAIFEDGFIRED